MGSSAARWRTWVRYAAWIALAVFAALAVALGVGWVLTPSVAGAPGLVRAKLAAHHDPALRALPEPDLLAEALIATEDHRFAIDVGVDPIGLARAFVQLVQGSPDPGGATLSQQLAKMLYTGGRGGLGRDLEQVVLAVKFNVFYSKAQILRMYLNTAYFGNDDYGAAAASEGYFGLPPARLDWAQASLLAGLVQAPTAYDPLTHLRLAKQRQAQVLNRLVAVGTLTESQAVAVSRAPLGLH